MTKKINSLDQFAMAINTAARGAEFQIRKAIAEAVVRVHSDAVKMFGTYQPQVGSFQAWKTLNSAYVRLKRKAGATGDDPLIGHYSGNRKNKIYPTSLRNAILMEVHGLYGTIGTNDPLGKWHEFGTHKIPARPFLRPALFKNREWIRLRLKEAVAIALREVY